MAAVKELFAQVAADLVYARVRRENDPHRAESPETHQADRPRHYYLDAIAYEDHLAPDAYAVQLLGPGYRERLPDGGEWRTTELPGRRVLLEHADPAGWFDEIRLEAAIRGRSVPSSALRAQARASIAPILFPDVEYTDGERPGRARADVWLPQSIVMKTEALGASSIALVLDDGGVVEDVELSHRGAVVARIAGDADFEFDPRRVTDAIDLGSGVFDRQVRRARIRSPRWL